MKPENVLESLTRRVGTPDQYQYDSHDNQHFALYDYGRHRVQIFWPNEDDPGVMFDVFVDGEDFMHRQLAEGSLKQAVLLMRQLNTYESS